MRTGSYDRQRSVQSAYPPIIRRDCILGAASPALDLWQAGRSLQLLGAGERTRVLGRAVPAIGPRSVEILPRELEVAADAGRRAEGGLCPL